MANWEQVPIDQKWLIWDRFQHYVNTEHKKYIKEHGVDMEEVVNFEFDFLGGKQYEL